MATETATASFFTGQRRIIVGVFVVLCLALAMGYYLFLRTDYAVLYTDLKPADASAIVAELDAKGVSHRLRDNGTTILVPTDQTDNVRLAVAGSDIPMKGSVGFELFNKSDMGLTDFAQKINYQRALQGELARTIMMMDGIETARIHLAIPERSLFRGSRSSPKAAVEVIPKLGRPITPDRVAGIQQLVASAVPDLPLDQVVVLDGDGRIISRAPVIQATETPEVEEQTAAQNYYSARARAALTSLMPGIPVGVRTLVIPRAGTADDNAAPSDMAMSPQNSPKSLTTGVRDFQLRVTVLTATALDAEDQRVARNGVATAIGLDEAHGDSLAFEVGPTAPPASISTAVLSPSVIASPAPSGVAPSAGPVELERGVSWWSLSLAVIAAAIAIVLFLRSRSDALTVMARDAFVDRVRMEIRSGGGADARI